MLKKLYRLRLILIAFVSMVVFATVEARLYNIQIVKYGKYLARAADQQSKRFHLNPRRGDILDRNGNTLATSYVCDTIILDTRKLDGAPPEMINGLVQDLTRILNRPLSTVRQLFERPRRHILYRKAPEQISAEIHKLDQEYMERYDLDQAIFLFEDNSKRTYPNGSLAGPIIGFTKIDDSGDNIGLAGLELQYNDLLKGSYQEEKIPVTSGQQGLAPLSDELVAATYGNTIVLTLDQEIQMFTERALRRRVGEVQALGGVAMVMDVKTGEILALANCPDFDPNDFAKAEPNQRKNRALGDPIEIGSVMKILTTALLLDNGLVSPDEMIDCQGGAGYVDGRFMKDSHHQGVVPFREAFAESSNIALMTVGLRLEPSVYYEGLRRFGMGEPTGIDLPGEGGGILYPLERWTRKSRTSLPIGYEIGLTAMQVVSALAAVGNYGERMLPCIIKEVRTHKGRVVMRNQPRSLGRVVSRETSQTLLELMEKVVAEGTGTSAQVPGFRIAGKTGTTRKSQFRDSKRYIASFAGLMPAGEPRLAVYVYIDEPQGREFYGGQIAAPVFKEIALYSAHILGIQPDDPDAFATAWLKLSGNGSLQPTSLPFAAGQPATQPAVADAVVAEDPMAPYIADDPMAAYIAGGTTDTLGAEAVGDGPEMPSCLGMTLRQAYDALYQAGIEPDKMLGSGVVVRQDPAPGRRVSKWREVVLILTHPSEIEKNVGVAAQKSAQWVAEPVKEPQGNEPQSHPE